MTRDATPGETPPQAPDTTTSGPILRGAIQHPDMPRPAHPDTAESWEWRVEPDRDWGPAIPGRQCRYGDHGSRCRNRGVVSLYRGYGTSTRPWAYCAQHLYGRWIEHGHVMTWRYQGAR